MFGPSLLNNEFTKAGRFGTDSLPVLDTYAYSGIVFGNGCKWEAHIAGMIEKATASIEALQTFFQNRKVSFEVTRTMLLALIKQTNKQKFKVRQPQRVQCGSEVWWATSQQANNESKIQIEVLKRSLHCKPDICHKVLRAEAGVRHLCSWLDQRKVEWWYKLQQKDSASLSRQALEASWPRHRSCTSWQKELDTVRAELRACGRRPYKQVGEQHLPSLTLHTL